MCQRTWATCLNSNPKDAGDVVLLDRPDELLAGIGFDFPVNEHFQPIAEVRSTQYVGGRTPNAFENNPVEFLAALRSIRAAGGVLVSPIVGT